MEYRREIDGLRALAIIPVILFHAGFQAFSGGFVGVDVFFVISGYLITSIILAEKQAGTFSIINFYERRARRILPALLFVVLACMPFAWLLMSPQEMKDFSQSLIAVPTFASNILFWQTSGYFEAASELKPLIHTWSLAVEEQYYIFFPIFLILTWRLGKRWILVLLGLVALSSLAVAQWAVISKPSFAFFMLPTRGWELLSGAFIAFHFSNKNNQSTNQSTSQSISGLGLLLVCFAVFNFDQNTPFPSVYTLVPTLGAALVILFANPQTLVGKLLGSKVLVGIGLVSYSAYLWHQPLLTFSRYAGLGDKYITFLCVLLFALAFISWRYVETPFRNKQLFNSKQIFIYSFAGSCLLVCSGLFGHLRNGDVGQVSNKEKDFLSYFENGIPEWHYFQKMEIPKKFRLECDFFDTPNYKLGISTRVPLESISSACYKKNKVGKSVFIWGDSHAQQLYWGLKQNLPRDWSLLQVASSGCVASIDAVENKKNYCDHSNWFALKKIKELKPEVVVIGQNLGHNAAEMKRVYEALISVGVGKVVFTGPTPHWKRSLPNIIAKNFLGETPRRTFSHLDTGVSRLDSNIKHIFPKYPKGVYVSIIDYFCNDSGCITYFDNDVKEGITTWDGNHLTLIASYYFTKDVLANIVQK